MGDVDDVHKGRRDADAAHVAGGEPVRRGIGAEQPAGLLALSCIAVDGHLAVPVDPFAVRVDRPPRPLEDDFPA
ncbi:hypothetical protein ACFYWN_22805 [Streptomyces sp. NPDC002917]|uniref:hypothetical protein n=1 Tax=Streptomyces sp. NPDC002917 TaxID=3364671 RepID=UPI00367D4BC7